MKDKEIKRISLFFISSAVCSLASMIINLVLTRMMDTKTYGLLGMLYSVSAVVVGIVCLGSDNAYTRFFFERPNNDSIESYSSKSIKIIVLPMILVSVVFLVGWTFFSDSLFGKKSIALIVGVIVYSISLVFYRFQNIYFRMIGDGLKFAFQSFLVLVLPKLVMLLVFLLLHNINAIVSMTIVSLFASMILLVPYRNTFFSFGNNNFFGYKTYISYALMTAPLIGIDSFNSWIPQYLIKSFCGLEILGIYNAALIFPAGINVLKSCFITIWAPYVYKNYKNEDGFFDQFNRIMTCAVILFMGGILLFSDYLYLLVGTDYRYECHILGLIIFIPLILLLFETTSYGISISNKVYIQTILISVISLLIFLGGSLVGKPFGLVGVLIVIASAYYIYYMLCSIISNKYLKMTKSMTRVILGGLVLLSLAILFIKLYDNRIWFNLIDCVIMFLYMFIYKKDLMSVVVNFHK